MRCLELYNKIKQVNIKALTEKSIDDTKQTIVALNKEQLHEGLNSAGQNFTEYRNKYYAKRKFAINPIPGIGKPDLELTGSFYRGIKVTVSNGKIITTSTDEKTKFLDKRYDDDLIFGLGDPFKEQYLEVVRPVYRSKVKEITGL